MQREEKRSEVEGKGRTGLETDTDMMSYVLLWAMSGLSLSIYEAR